MGKRGPAPKYTGCTECDNPKHYARGLCSKHYQLMSRNGYPGYVVREVTLCECGKEAKVKGMCRNCYQSWYYYNLETKPVNLNHANAKETPGYAAAHGRIRRVRGRAHDYNCVDCGEQATNWALKADATDLLAEAQGRYMDTKYSIDPFDYQPMCQACHKAFDADEGHRKHKAGMKKVEL